MTQSTETIKVVVLTGGAELQPEVLEFAQQLEWAPLIELTGIFCEAEGTGLRATAADLWRRRGLIALPLFVQALLKSVLKPRSQRRLLRRLSNRIHVVPNLHDPRVLAELRELHPDLGLVYGGPILQAALYDLPAKGTLGIHHGLLPKYRGKKTTFWAMYNGEPEVGVAIQRVSNVLDGGEIVAQATVAVADRSLYPVKKDLRALGLQSYLHAIHLVRTEKDAPIPQRGAGGKLYKDPTPQELFSFWMRYLRNRIIPNPQRDNSLCLVTETFHPVKGGGENQARILADGLADAGLDVTVITRRTDRPLPQCESLGGVRVVRVGPSGKGSTKKWLMTVPLVIRLLTLGRTYNHILVCGFRALGLPSVLGAWILGRRCYLKADVLGELSGAIFQRRLENRFSQILRLPLAGRRWILSQATGFVAVSSVVLDELTGQGIPVAKITRIANAVDTEIFKPVDAQRKRQLRGNLGLPKEDQLVAFTGRLESTKGLPTLLAAWRQVAAKHPHATLLLIGSGGLGTNNCEAQLRAYVDDHALQSRVRFVGSVENVHEYLQASDVFVFPSEQESFGVSVAEAMACALPVVATTSGGLKDLVQNDVNAISVPIQQAQALADGLSHTLSSDMSHLGNAARRFILQHCAVNTVLAQYQQLLTPAPSA